MSADNYAVIRKFGKNDFRWAMFFASDDEPDMSNEAFKSKSFKTPLEAEKNAYEEYEIIEYGIQFEPECFVTEEKDMVPEINDEQKNGHANMCACINCGNMHDLAMIDLINDDNQIIGSVFSCSKCFSLVINGTINFYIEEKNHKKE